MGLVVNDETWLYSPMVVISWQRCCLVHQQASSHGDDDVIHEGHVPNPVDREPILTIRTCCCCFILMVWQNSEKERYELDALLSLVKKERKSRSTDQFCRY
jgi:hypothetical protein